MSSVAFAIEYLGNRYKIVTWFQKTVSIGNGWSAILATAWLLVLRMGREAGGVINAESEDSD